ncbi:hypothetical protein NW768_006817 [Fusarium equiseti]|uniref:F-box domain-containing protein n=1 Tax=Fusarium equiseti TaxID=61235 RepID=A0ABQ8R994_FUSEQ|nr:hypothetical protein NW768_006817 [Fusarium equiseti]
MTTQPSVELSRELIFEVSNMPTWIGQNIASTPHPDGTSFLVKLPTELITEIFKACHVSDHFNLSLTCHRLAEGGAPILARHRAAARDYGVVTDWHHLTIPAVLNKVIEDPYVRYNVRHIEIYGTRYSWEHWGEFRAESPPTVEILPTPPPEIVVSPTFEGGDVWHNFEWRQVFDRPTWQEIWGPAHAQIGPEFDEDTMTYTMLGQQRRTKYQQSIIDKNCPVYVALMQLLGWFAPHRLAGLEMNDPRAPWAGGLLAAGNDSLLKALLICICPRLNFLRHASCKDNKQGIEVMDWLTRVIAMSWRLQRWAPGLKSLLQVSIGVPTGLWFEDRHLGGFYEEYAVRSIMLLPGLKAAYFGTIRLDGENIPDVEGSIENPPPFADLTGASSVEHLFIDQFVDVFHQEANGYTAEAVMEFLLVPKKLKQLIVRGGIEAQVVGELEDQALYLSMLHLRKHLMSVIEYNCRLRPHEPTWNWLTKTDQVRKLYRRGVKHITINATNLLSVPPGPRPHIPPNAEAILVQKSYDDDEELGEDGMKVLEDRLIKEVIDNEGYLKAIYIEQQVHPDTGMIDEYEFNNLIDYGGQFGVDVHVKANSDTPLNPISFPSSPLMSMGVKNAADMVVFDPFMGRWTKK